MFLPGSAFVIATAAGQRQPYARDASLKRRAVAPMSDRCPPASLPVLTSSERHNLIGAEPSSGTVPQSRKPTSRPVGLDLDETHTPIRSQLEFDQAAGLNPKLIACRLGIVT